MLTKVFNRLNNFINKPNFKSEHKYNYDHDTNLILKKLRYELNKVTKVSADNYMDDLDQNISYQKREQIKKKVLNIFKSNLEKIYLKKLNLTDINKNYLDKIFVDGYSRTNNYDFEKKEVDEIVSFSENFTKFPGHIISNSNKPTISNLSKSPYYTFQPSDILSSKIIQKKIFNENFINLVENYFEFTPTCITMNLYCQKKKISKFDFLPQFFHRDYHDLKLLTFFVFLSDTEKDNGSHCYIKYSHDHKIMEQFLNTKIKVKIEEKKKSSIDFFQLDKNSYGHENFLNLLNENYEYLYGERGTSFLTNNYGLHRAIEPNNSKRLIFWLSFGIFNNQNIKRLPKRILASKIKNLPNKNLDKYKYIYRNYINFNE